MCYCGLFLSSQSGPYSNTKEKTSEGSLVAVLRSGWKAKVMVFLLAMTNIPLALYTCTVHQKGTVDVMEYIQVESSKLRSNDDMSVLFLMPCHSTPFYRYRTIHSKHNILGGSLSSIQYSLWIILLCANYFLVSILLELSFYLQFM